MDAPPRGVETLRRVASSAMLVLLASALPAQAADALSALRDIEREATNPNLTESGLRYTINRARPVIEADAARDPAANRALGAYTSALAEFNAGLYTPESAHVINADCPMAVNYVRQIMPLAQDAIRSAPRTADSLARLREMRASNHATAASLYAKCGQDWQRIAERNAQRAAERTTAPAPTCTTRPDGVVECGNR